MRIAVALFAPQRRVGKVVALLPKCALRHRRRYSHRVSSIPFTLDQHLDAVLSHGCWHRCTPDRAYAYHWLHGASAMS